MLFEAVVISYLKQKLNTSAVYGAIPTPLPEDNFVVVSLDDGGRRNLVETVSLAISSYAQSQYEAAQFNEDVKTAMDSITDLSTISSSKLSTWNNAPDTNIKRYRYRCHYNLSSF